MTRLINSILVLGLIAVAVSFGVFGDPVALIEAFSVLMRTGAIFLIALAGWVKLRNDRLQELPTEDIYDEHRLFGATDRLTFVVYFLLVVYFFSLFFAQLSTMEWEKELLGEVFSWSAYVCLVASVLSIPILRNCDKAIAKEFTRRKREGHRADKRRALQAKIQHGDEIPPDTLERLRKYNEPLDS